MINRNDLAEIGLMNSVGTAGISERSRGIKVNDLTEGKVSSEQFLHIQERLENLILLLQNDQVPAELTIKPKFLNALSDDQCSKLFQALGMNTSITRLVMDNHSFNQQRLVFLADALIQNKFIRELSLGYCGLNLLDPEPLCKALENNSTLQALDLKYNELNDAFISRLSTALCKNQSLQSLSIERSDCSNEGLDSLAKLLKSTKILEELDLSFNFDIGNIGGNSFKNFMLALAENRTLLSLNMSDCNLSDYEALYIRLGLSKNSVLKTFDLSNNFFNEYCLASIAEGVAQNSSLLNMPISCDYDLLDENGCFFEHIRLHEGLSCGEACDQFEEFILKLLESRQKGSSSFSNVVPDILPTLLPQFLPKIVNPLSFKIYQPETACQLVYKGKVVSDLKAVFSTLYFATDKYCQKLAAKTSSSKKSEQMLVPKKPTQASTNFVAAMLGLIISENDPPTIYSSANNPTFTKMAKQETQHYCIWVPIESEKPTLEPLSKDKNDGVFKDDREFESMIVEDEENSAKTTQINPKISGQHKRKLMDMTHDLLDIFDIFKTAEEREAFKKKMEAANIVKPHKAAFLSLSSKAKQIDYHHSERVLFAALKKPETVKKLLLSAEKEARMQFPHSKKFNIHAGVLAIYSNPNPICGNCTKSFIALQNSYEKGFIKNIIDALSIRDAAFLLHKSRGLNIEGRPKFKLSIIGASKIMKPKFSFGYQKYSKSRSSSNSNSNNIQDFNFVSLEQQSQILKKNEQSIQGMGIELRKKKGEGPHQHIYEFAELTFNEMSKPMEDYSGFVAMSGSKQSKKIIFSIAKSGKQNVGKVGMKRKIFMANTQKESQNEPQEEMNKVIPTFDATNTENNEASSDTGSSKKQRTV